MFSFRGGVAPVMSTSSAALSEPRTRSIVDPSALNAARDAQADRPGWTVRPSPVMLVLPRFGAPSVVTCIGSEPLIIGMRQ